MPFILVSCRLIILLSVIAPISSLAQRGFKPGYLVTPSGDSLRGLIRFDNKTRSAGPCVFKADAKAPAQEYLPGMITSFRYVNNSYFVSRSVGRSSDVFLEVVVKGYLTLYKFGDIFFVEKGDSVFFELSDDMEVVLVEGENRKKKSRNYTKLLNLLMADCLEASRKVPAVPFKEKPLIKLVALYNTCRGYENKYYRSKLRP